MIHDGRVTGLPLVQYRNTKANIAALPLTAADAGAEAYATDTGEKGVYSGSAWVWGKTVTNGNAHDHDGGDGAQIDHTKLSNVGTNTHAQIDSHLASTANPHSTTAAQVGADVTTATIHAATAKSTPVDTDETALLDNAANYGLKKLTWAALKTTLKTYFDTLYNKYVHPNHTGDVTSVGDGATALANKQTLTATPPITVSNSPTVIAGAAPVIAVNAASEAAVGVVERATDAEALTMTDTTRYVSPSQLGKYTVTDQLFGNGADGNVTISSTTTLTRDMYYNTLTVNSGIVLNTGGYRIFVKGTLTLNGTIRNSGGNGGNASGLTGGVAGAAAAGGSLKASLAGKVGAVGVEALGGASAGINGNAGNAESASDGGSAGVAGGAGGYDGGTPNPGGTGGAGGTVTAASAAYGDLKNPFMGVLFRLFTTTGVIVPGYHAGNGSGGSGAVWNASVYPTASGAGGGSGGNGGYIVLVARIIAGTGTISVAGGAGGAGAAGSGFPADAGGGGGGGGAGGNGGIIVLMCVSRSAITLNISGGTGGTGGAPIGEDVYDGSAGSNGRNGLIIEF